MSLIAPQPKAREKEQLTVRLERPTYELLKRYCEFIESTQDYVLNQALVLTFQRDKAFNEWLVAHPNGADVTGLTRKKGGKRERSTTVAESV